MKQKKRGKKTDPTIKRMVYLDAFVYDEFSSGS